ESCTGCIPLNLGTGTGYSVLEVVKSMEEATGFPIPYKIMPRRAGDIDTIFADPSLAEQLLGWTAKRSLGDMCADTWRWQSANRNGYRK
ncbi:unnamed protein product, partial [Ascophyllum nodosum]